MSMHYLGMKITNIARRIFNYKIYISFFFFLETSQIFNTYILKLPIKENNQISYV